MRNVSLEQFGKMIPGNGNVATWHQISQELFPKYQIDTRNRIAGFMAQAGHESGNFRVISENVNYTWQRLRQVFPGYFKTDAHAQQFHRQPEKIANFVYDDRNPARRNKLGNVRDGDGWRFRGAGLMQLTGRSNFNSFGYTIGMSAEQAADYTRTQKGAFESACWFWNSRGLNQFADVDDIRRMSILVNGGTIGLADRTSRYNRNKLVLESTTSQSAYESIRKGSRGETVRKVQQALKIMADGIFGNGTEKAVQSWQRINRYNPNGILTPDQIEKLLK